MKTIDLTHASADVADLLEKAREDDVVLRLADGSEYLLIAVDDDFDVEVQRSRSNPKLMALLDARAHQTSTVPLDEVKRRLGL
jgi:hypothetical protein